MTMAQRVDMLAANQASRGSLESLGLQFNKAESYEFRTVLTKSGYDQEWKAKYGHETWAMLEKVTGPLG